VPRLDNNAKPTHSPLRLRNQREGGPSWPWTHQVAARDFPLVPPEHDVLHLEAAYMSTTGLQTSKKQPCPPGWVHTCEFDRGLQHLEV
jgi:hypothetical protein